MFEDSVSSPVPSIWASMNSWLTPTVLFLFLNLMIGAIFITSSLATNKHSEQQEEDKQVLAQQQHSQQLVRSPSVLQKLKSINFYSYRSQEPTSLTFAKPQEFDHHFTTLQETPQQEYPQHQSPLSRSPSVLQRLKSINLYTYFSQEPISNTIHKTQETRGPQQDHELKEEQGQQTQEQKEEEEVGGGGEENGEIQDQEQTLDEIYSKLQGINKVNRSKSDTKPTSGEVPTKLTKKMKKSASLKSAFAHFEEEGIVESRRPATVRESKTTTMAEVDDAEVDAKADDFINKFKQQLKLQRIDSTIRYKEMINRGH